MESRRHEMKQQLLGLIGRDGVFSVLVTRRRTRPDVLRVNVERGRLEPVREFRKLPIWFWRRPLLAPVVAILILLILLSLAMNWVGLAPRLGGLLMIAPLIGFFFRAYDPGVLEAPEMGADFLDMPFTTYARRVELGIVLLGALVWAFGDWGASFIHCGGMTCSS